MVDTRRLEKLMRPESAQGKETLPAVVPARGEVAPQRHALALSGHREMRKAGQSRRLSAQREAQIHANWAQLRPCTPAPVKDKLMSQFNLAARDVNVVSRFDLLRTQLATTFRKRDLVTLGITAPIAGAGTSFVTAGLIAAMARRAKLRVVGLDLNLAGPALHRYFEIEPAYPLMDVALGDVTVHDALERITDSVAVMVSSEAADAMSHSMLTPEDMRATLTDIHNSYAPHMIICDLPPLLEGDLSLIMCGQMDAVLMVADSQSTRADEMIAAERLLEGQAEFLGVILNKNSGKAAR